MLKRLAEKIWLVIPYKMRIRSVRKFQQKFTVSVVAVITNENAEVLILDHFFRPRSSWGLPGGFLDSDETPEKAIRRELMEEAALELTDVKLFSVRTIGTHIEILFRARASGEGKVNSGEIRDLGWFSVENLPEISESQAKFLKNMLSENRGRD